MKRFLSNVFSSHVALSEESLSKILTPQTQTLYQQALTHKSFDRKKNYEYLEFQGDVVVNTIIVQYLKKRFPKISSVKWFTKLKHNLASKSFLSKVGEGLFPRELIRHNLENPSVHERESLYEDMFEAFIGVTKIVFDSFFEKGTGYAISYYLVESLFNEIPLDISASKVFDAKTLLKEIYDNYKWNFEKNFNKQSRRSGETFVSVVGYVHGDQTVTRENEKVIAKAFHKNTLVAQNTAAEIALRSLSRYGIEPKLPSPYQELSFELGPEDSVPTITISDDLVVVIRSLLFRSGMNCDLVEKISSDSLSLFEFQKSLTDKTYHPLFNSNLHKILGITIVDMGVISYLVRKFPELSPDKKDPRVPLSSEKWLTTIKHRLISTGVLYEFAVKSRIPKFVLFGKQTQESFEKYGTDSSEYRSTIESAFKALMGALSSQIEKYQPIGVGMETVSRILTSFLEETPISTKIEDVVDAKTRLKELYDKLGWRLDKNISSQFNTETNLHIIEIYGFPLGDRRPYPKNRVLLSQKEGRTKKDATQKASKEALGVLSSKYRIGS